LELYYQHAPHDLSVDSVYRAVQQSHEFAAVGGLIPDLVLRLRASSGDRWVIVEVKGVERSVTDSARAALQNLLAYRRAFSAALDGQIGPYGIGIAWGEQVAPAVSAEVVLCSPDTIGEALDIALETP
jgi:hypothetical protein